MKAENNKESRSVRPSVQARPDTNWAMVESLYSE